MTKQEEIKRLILKIAGNPVSGPVNELAEEWARAIVALDEEPTKETRVLSVKETR